jgi:hypothetical protein
MTMLENAARAPKIFMIEFDRWRKTEVLFTCWLKEMRAAISFFKSNLSRGGSEEADEPEGINDDDLEEEVK